MIEYYEFQNVPGKYLPPFHIFCTETHLFIQNFFLGYTFLIVNRFSKFLQHILGQTYRRILQRKYSS